MHCRIRLGSALSATAKMPRRVRGAQPFDVRHARRRVAARVDDDDVGRRTVAGDPVVDDADRNRSGAEQPSEVLLEAFVFRKNESDQLCHGYWTKRMAVGNAFAGAGPAFGSTRPVTFVITP